MAKLPGRGLRSVRGMLERYNHKDPAFWGQLEKKSWTLEEKALLLRLREAGPVVMKKIMVHFPNRSYGTIKNSLLRPISDPWWTSQTRKIRRWTEKEKDLLAREIPAGVRDDALALSLGRSTSSVKKMVQACGIQRPRRWTPEKDRILSRMAEEGHKFKQIALHLSTSRASAEMRWGNIRSRPPARRGDLDRLTWKMFSPTLAEAQEVERLRQEGCTWEAITAQKFPDRMGALVRTTFLREFGSMFKTTPKDLLNMSSVDVQEIECLRQEGCSWQEITQQKYPGRSRKTVCSAYTRRIEGRCNVPTFEISCADDLQGIGRLREAKNTWETIRDLKFPDESVDKVRKTYKRQMKAHSDEKSNDAASTEEGTTS